MFESTDPLAACRPRLDDGAMHLLVAEIERACRRLNVSNCGVLVAVSGGADSVALLRGLLESKTTLRLTISAGHLDHGLRDTAAQDADWVGRLCEAHGVAATIGRMNVPNHARDGGLGIEEAARDARYAFLKAAAIEKGCAVVAAAHTSDDQAETILHHILRGTGLGGLRGMPDERPLADSLRLVRPMLDVSRGDVLDYLGSLSQEFRIDESNFDEAYTRNRLRQSLLPQLERDYNPGLRAALCRLGRQAGQAQAAIEACAKEAIERALERAGPHECRLRWQPLAQQSRHLLREALAELWRRQQWPRQAMTFAHWDRLAELVVAGGAGDFPGGVHARRSDRLCIIQRAAGSDEPA